MLKKNIVLLLISCHVSFVFCGFFTRPNIARRSDKKVHSVKEAFQEEDELEEDSKSEAEIRSESNPPDAKLKKHKSREDGTFIEFNSGNAMSNGNHTRTSLTSTHQLYFENPLFQQDEGGYDTNTVARARSHSGKSIRTHHSSTKHKCVEKCYTPKCDVECVGRQGTAACSATSCSSETHGELSVSLCTGKYCHAMCFDSKCTAGCEGSTCVATCFGKGCYAISHGPASLTLCEKKECTVYANGLEVQAQCIGTACQAHCSGTNCTAVCNGTRCVSGCKGQDCTAACVGADCHNQVVTESNSEEMDLVANSNGVTDIVTPPYSDPTQLKDASLNEGNSPSNAVKGKNYSGIINFNVQKNLTEPGQKAVFDYDIAFQLNEVLLNFLREKVAGLRQNLPTLNLLFG